MKPEYKYLSIRLELEKQRLLNWSAEIGLLTHLGNGDDTSIRDALGLSHTTVVETLLQMEHLTAEFIKCRQKCGELVPDDTPHENFGADNWHTSESNLRYLPNSLPSPRRITATKIGIKTWPGRMKWAALYKDQYEQLINKVRDLNDVLICLVDSNARIAIRRSTRETNTTVLHMHNQIEELVQLVKAVTPDYGASYTRCSTTTSRTYDPPNIQGQRDLANLAYFKAVNKSVEANSYFNLDATATGGRPIREIELDRSQFDIKPVIDVGLDRCEADFQPSGQVSRRVWIEWRHYDPIYLAQPILKPSRIDKLVALLSDSKLPASLRVPRCLGYFDDPKRKTNGYRKGRLGFVFEKPTAMDGLPVSLHELFKGEFKPVLGDRIALAVAIGNSLMSLHSVNWLHKGLRSHNVIFFPDQLEEKDPIDLTAPYLSGFGYARPIFREDMTEVPSQNPEHDMYRHPRTHNLGPWEGRQGFKRTFDIYSLGIILTEIAMWQGIDQVLGFETPNSLGDTELADIQPRLLSE